MTWLGPLQGLPPCGRGAAFSPGSLPGQGSRRSCSGFQQNSVLCLGRAEGLRVLLAGSCRPSTEAHSGSQVGVPKTLTCERVRASSRRGR